MAPPDVDSQNGEAPEALAMLREMVGCDAKQPLDPFQRVTISRTMTGGYWMGYEPGRLVWIPCEVKPGPFSDERMVRIPSERGEWVAFVHVNELREPVGEGSTFVRAVLLNVEGGRYNARIAGEPLVSSFFEGALNRIEPFAALQA